MKNDLPVITSETGLEEQSFFSQAYTTIEKLIVTLELKPGQVVSENMLANLLGLGRTPVREALQMLARDGLVVIFPKRGIVISEMDVSKQLRMLEVRREVERYLVGASARRARPEERQHFLTLAKDMDRAAKTNDGEAFLAMDLEFNKLLLSTARNEFAVSAMRLIQGLSSRFWFAHYRDSANLPVAARLHACIARAIAESNEEEACICLDKLLDNVDEFTRSTLNPDRSTRPPYQQSRKR
ncbi:GntR family transcriptional regulator [Glaciimonas soli]|uniref:GntR family transcriptional regulator n=1 Tax=Glaciimonas soli TaxID=2590999 RepID=A0A843YUD5_9BURK|nr:GntR family transcriptional regulator [Glaciimonas soli]MQR01233.1 GntR family transcriptional regulator [Glaciimonas soli]